MIYRATIIVLSFVLLAAFCGCQPSSEQGQGIQLNADRIDGACAFENVRRLVKITPRNSGSEGAAKAAEFLKNALEAYTDSCEIDTFEDITPQGKKSFRNVIGILKGGSSKTILLGSHYDTKAGISEKFQGANDSGSSSGLLLELARVLHDSEQLPYTVVFAFFDGEESLEKYSEIDGLHGSRRFAKQLKAKGQTENIKAMILLDMIGDSDLTVTIPRNVDSGLRKSAFAAARKVGIRNKFSLSRTAVLDDHVPFIEVGIPAIDLIDFKYGSAPGLNDYWHTDGDNMDHISKESLEAIGQIVIYMLNDIVAD